jgi:hypothetical protein
MPQEEKQSDEEIKKRRRVRSIAIGVALGLLVILFYAATLVRLGGNVFNKGF